MRPLLPATCLLLALLAPGAAAQTLLRTVRGLQPDDHLGGTAGPGGVAWAGDLDGDGHDDWIAATGIGGSNGGGYLLAVSGGDARVLYEVHGAAPGDGFGNSIASTGDLDGDGIADLVAGAPGADYLGPESGSVYVLSGADGALLRRLDGDFQGDRFGWSVTGLGDLTGDGRAEWAGASHEGPPNGLGYTHVHSGADGALLRILAGGRLARAGDVNGDGLDDLVVGNARELVGGLQTGRVRVYSGANGSLLYSLDGDAPGDDYGHDVDGCGDRNGDGLDDFAASALIGGYTRVYSGADGSVLQSIPGWGSAFCAAGDLDGDGCEDLFVTGATRELLSAGQAVSGADGRVLFEFFGDAFSEFFWQVAGGGDADADGRPDLLIGGAYTATPGADRGLVQVLASAPGLQLAAPAPGQAGTMNTVTVTGAEPGGLVLLAGQRLPGTAPLPLARATLLVPFAGANGLPFVKSLQADAGGAAALSFRVPAAFAGRELRMQAAEYQTGRLSGLSVHRFP